MAVDLRQWASRPRRAQNIAAAVLTGVLMIWIFSASAYASDPEMFLRRTAVLVMSVHWILHLLSVNGLRALARKNVAGAMEAWIAYTDPCRLSHRDQAVAWIAFFAVAPHLL